MNKTKAVKKNKEIAIYKDSKGNIDFRIDGDKETLWATQADIALLFDVQRPAITKHLKNIFESKELNEKSVCSILEHTADDGKSYKVQYIRI